MKMVVGLGNPGSEYENTRHNVGFMILDSFIQDFKVEKKFQACVSKMRMGNEEVLFVKPLTFMNLSGIAILKIAKYYHILPKDILVIQDDLDLTFGTYKLKINSSSGGHNGIKSIISSLQTEGFCRLKIGISHDKRESVIDYVLGKFSKKEINQLKDSSSFYQEIIEYFISYGIEKTMNKFN